MRRLDLLVCVSLVAVSLLVISFAQAGESAPQANPKAQAPEVWLCHHDLHDLLRKDAKWDFVRKHLDGIKIYIGTLSKRYRAAKWSDDTLKEFVAMLKDNDIKLAVETGGTVGHRRVDENNGKASAEAIFDKLDRVYAAGGKIDYLDMDGPVSRLLYTGRHRHDFGKKWEWQGLRRIRPCVEQLMIHMKVMRAKYPNMQFFTLTNFPNWGYKGGISYHARHENRQDWGDYYDVISMIIPAAKSEGLPLVGVTVDNPYDYAIGRRPSATLKDPAQVNWLRRVRNLEDYTERKGLEFNLIINSERPGKDSNELFYKETLDFLEAYRAAGGSPKRYIVQSWEKHPTEVVPETKPYTMTALAMEVIKRVKGISK